MTAMESPHAAFRDRTLAEIATSLPGATGIFRRRKLDFCCGGRVPLAQAAAQRGVSIDELEFELEGVAALGVAADRPESTEELIELIETHGSIGKKRGRQVRRPLFAPHHLSLYRSPAGACR